MPLFKQPQPILINNLNRIKPLIHRLPMLQEMTINSTLNTVVACRVCYGHGYVYTRNRQTNIMHKSYCPHCSGLKTMKNGDGK